MSAARRAEARGPAVVVCRGCCCGSGRKHPTTDHAGQLRRLRDQLGDTARLRVSDCLGHCQYSNLVAIIPATEGRQRGGRTAWLGWILDNTAIDTIAAWARAGGPGLADPPTELALHEVRIPRPA